MLDSNLPSSAIVVETRQDSLSQPLLPEERSSVSKAVGSRRWEFTTARTCARTALGGLGLSVVAIPAGPRGEPLWPPGVVGSITHCEGYRACAVARMDDLMSIGIDAEPHAKRCDQLTDPHPRKLGILAKQRVGFEEVSLGHPREWQHRGASVNVLRRIVRSEEP
jgi:4'-phosphopantetheinyl transferase N-terminal domain